MGSIFELPKWFKQTFEKQISILVTFFPLKHKKQKNVWEQGLPNCAQARVSWLFLQSLWAKSKLIASTGWKKYQR